MKHSVKVGFSFGLTSGIITTLGLLVGLFASTHSRSVVIGGILTIAIADAMSDALGIHVSEESENKHTTKEIWASTLSTFAAKFTIALTFIVPFLATNLNSAITLSIIWGLSLLSALSYLISKKTSAVIEHLTIAAVVIALTYFVGIWISTAFT